MSLGNEPPFFQKHAPDAYDQAIRNVAQVGQLSSNLTRHEMAALLDSIASVNSAIDKARKAGWTVEITTHSPDDREAGSGPFRVVRASITREV